MLNKAILHVATRYMESHISSSFTQFVLLGTKASTWCRKHIQITRPIGECQEETDSELFSQLILDTFSFSSTSMSALTRTPILGEKVVMLIVENFILELLHLTKASVLEIKRIHTIASEVLKMAQVVLDAAIKLCRAYFQAIGSNSSGSIDDIGVDYTSHVICITSNTIENLLELGVFAASGGGSLVTLLNVSWKGVVSLLQLGKGVLAEKINVGDIILTLVSLAIESLRCAAEAWSSTSSQALAISEAKRTFLPIKFYLINAVRISSEYPREAANVYRQITRCVLLVTSLGISLSKVAHLRAASEALAEFLEPTSFLLLHSLLNSKIQILDWLFTDEMNAVSAWPEESLNGIFYVDCDAMPRSEALMLGRVILFLNLLKASSALREQMVLDICSKLDYLLDLFTHEHIYSSILGLLIPVHGVAWQPMISFVLHALKTFMIVASSSSLAWMEVEAFLFRNLLHPHFLCVEIVRELWCFFIRHAEREIINHTVENLCLLLKVLASSEQTLTPLCPLRKMARSVCVILTFADSDSVDRVYNSILCDEDKSHQSTIVYSALLVEGFPLDSLSHDLRTFAVQKIASSFFGHIENDSQEIGSLLGLRVHAMSSALISCQIKNPDVIDDKYISRLKKFTLSLIHGYRNSRGSLKEHYMKLLGAMLDIISEAKKLSVSDELKEVIIELQTLFAAGSDGFLYQCKPSLASLLACICHMEIAEDEGNTLCSAIWSLYHVLLRERHWAAIHLAITAFGYFAARTSCTELWRFVPHDAALSFDPSTGNEANEDRFMSELKGVLDRDAALQEAAATSGEQLSLLVKEGMALRKLTKVTNTIPEVVLESSKNNDENKMKKKKRKVPDGICEGMELLQKGLKTMSNALSEAESVELKKAFSTHISCLEDVMAHLVGLSDLRD